MNSNQEKEPSRSTMQSFAHRVFESVYYWFREVRFRYSYRFVNPDSSMATPPFGWSTHRNLAAVFDVVGIALVVKAAKTFSNQSIEDGVLVAGLAVGSILIANALLLGLFLPKHK